MAVALTKEQKRACIQLRIDQNLSTPQIAKQVGICNCSVYKILRNYPWKKQRRAFAPRGKWWTAEEQQTLRQLWPMATRDEIIAALPGRAWTALSKQANFLKLKRRYQHGRPVHPIMLQLRDLREQARITRPQLSKKIGWHLNQILNWETGKTRPNLQHVEDLANGLGCTLVLRPKAESEIIHFPDQKRLMSGKS